LGLTNRTLEFFFPGGIHVEVACELPELIKCNTDMQSFKGYAHRFMSQATQVAPIIHDPIMKVLRTSAQAAVKACNPDGTCGFRWSTGAYDGMTGVGEEMNALGALLSMLVDERDIASPYTNGTGGTSQGDPNAGRDPEEFDRFKPPTAGAKAGAGILTAFILAALVAFIVWMSVGK
jgi:mannan endo-1,6-alpha-mannosidase